MSWSHYLNCVYNINYKLKPHSHYK
ncbi:hypothetical protein J6O57_13185 [Escherichia coli]|nr:hypothetical protein [Escherichia coli]UAP55469.1 hypothetical protein J6O57_13185 [Escherichia coli]UAP59850.1 hypothetical protein J6O05_13190 [Escherichia coli]